MTTTKTLLFIRHAQALHNVDDKYSPGPSTTGAADLPKPSYHLHDPPLTDVGVQQCLSLHDHLCGSEPVANKVELIVTSPMLRTLQTAEVSLRWLSERGVPTVALAELQEKSTNPCDIGSDIDVVRARYPKVDYDSVHPEWPSKEGVFAQTRPAIAQRGRSVREWLAARPEKVIAVVSHASILRIAITKGCYANSDYRIFTLDSGADADELIETAATMGAGGRGLSSTDPGGEQIWDTFDEDDEHD